MTSRQANGIKESPFSTFVASVTAGKANLYP